MSIRLSSEDQEELVLKNQRLVYYLANKFNVAASDYDDIVSIGTIGLIKAAITFDESKKIKFATYAARCIQNEILMHFRKEKSHVNDISLDSPISDDGKGNELTLEDKIADTTGDFTEKIAESEIFIRFISIVLNLLEPRERLIMLHKIAGNTQKVISEIFNISQSYISRLEKKVIKKVKSYLSTVQHFKGVFSMAIVGDSYQISFASKDIKHFNQIFATLLKNLTSVEDLPDFNVNCDKERILIRIPAHPESFSFIAQIIQEIDEFNMTFVSDKSISSKDSTVSQEVFSSDAAKNDGSVIETLELDASNEITTENSASTSSEVDTIPPADTTFTEKKGSQLKKVRDYMLSTDSFTVNDLRQHFPNESVTTINNALISAKKKGLITSSGRGTYTVNKT